MKTIKEYLIENQISERELSLIEKSFIDFLDFPLYTLEDFWELFGKQVTFYNDLELFDELYSGTFDNIQQVVDMFDDEDVRYSKGFILERYHFTKNGVLFLK